MTVQLRAPFRYVGRKRRVREDRRFVSGAGRYAADFWLPGMLHVAPVQSDHPCARIMAIDTAAALALPGVRAVLTGAQPRWSSATRWRSGGRAMWANGWR
jgi:CO/xanthine dehydrogenase Mo-binding subunit